MTAVQYLYGRFGNQAISLSDNNYNQLQQAWDKPSLLVEPRRF